MGADTPERLSERLTEEGARVEAFFKGLSASELSAQIYTEGSCWTVREILAHLGLAENSMCRLILNILQGKGGTPENFDLDSYNERKVAAIKGEEFSYLIEQFKERRLETIKLVRGLNLEQLELRGRHPFLGDASLTDIIKMIYRHNQIHIREIRRALNAGNPMQAAE